MRRIISITLIYSFVFGQIETSKSTTDKNASDKLVLNSRTDMGRYYTVDHYGEFLGHKQDKIYFKPTNEVLLKQLRLKEIKELTQNDKVLIQNGKWKIEPENIKTFTGAFINLEEINIKEYSVEELSVEEKAIYDAKKDAKKWLAYPTLALLSSGGLGSATFIAVEDIVDASHESSLSSAIIAGSIGLVGFHYFFNIEVEKNIKGTSADDIELYQQAYSKEFKDRKLKNIVKGFGLLCLTAGLGLFIFLSTFSFGSGYDAYMGP